MTNEEIKTQVDIMQKEREACTAEIDRLKKLCTHDKYELGYYSWRIGSCDIKKICAYCGEILGDPEFEEGREFSKKNNFSAGNI